MSESGTETSGAASSLRVFSHPVLGKLPEARPVTFRLDGREITGREGDTIAAALLAAGIRVCRTMPGSNAPRGPFCAVGRCTDCLMTVEGELNVRTCITPVRDGLRVETQQGLGRWGGGEA